MGVHCDSMARELDDLITEARDESAADLDLEPTRRLVDLMSAADAEVPAAVASAADAIAAAIDAIVERLSHGGRLLYFGAGTSGRIAALDAGECEATFSVPPELVTARVAGEGLASSADRDAEEDNAASGAAAVRELGVRETDAVVAVSASGRTPWTAGALEAAGERGALTICVVAAEASPLARLAEHEIAVIVGPELIAGSTRLKAGTAQKLVLNMLSTVTMIRLGKTYGNLMVDVRASNEKLRERARRIVREATGATEAEADAALAAAGGEARVAIVSQLAGLDSETARAKLDAVGGNIRVALLP
jgi:N-acetylmuramic acid 6-phosphate etherase